MNLTNTITKIDENNIDVEFDFGDFSLETDGNIHVIFSNSDISTPIYILKVILQLEKYSLLFKIEVNNRLKRLICGFRSIRRVWKGRVNC